MPTRSPAQGSNSSHAPTRVSPPRPTEGAAPFGPKALRHAGKVTDLPSSFPESLNRLVTSGVGDAVFGLNVLDRLVRELKTAASERRTERAWGPAVLGCAMWMDDPELLDVLRKMANACVVVTKQPRRKYARPETEALKALASTTGLAQGAYPELSELAAPRDGKPIVVGPWSRDWDDSEIHASA